MNTTNARRLHHVPDALAAVRATIESDFAGLREQQPRVLHLALNEAEVLAWQTGFPELLFPTLAQEKARQLAAWNERQQSLRRGGPVLAFAA